MGSTTGMTDYADAADEYETKLRDGDLVVLYTDGLSDNVFNSEITAICSLVARAGGSEEQQVQTMADRIVDYARSCMNNMTRVSPFESRFSPHHRETVAYHTRRGCGESSTKLVWWGTSGRHYFHEMFLTVDAENGRRNSPRGYGPRSTMMISSRTYALLSYTDTAFAVHPYAMLYPRNMQNRSFRLHARQSSG